MDADVLLEMLLLISFSPWNRLHEIRDLDRTRNCPFNWDWERTIRAFCLLFRWIML